MLFQEFPPREVLSGGYLLTKFRPDLIQLVLDRLDPRYVRVGVASQCYDGQTSCTEPWYNSQYNVKKIGPASIDLWSAASPIEELHLPAINEFIPTDFDLVPLNKDCTEVSAVPKLIMVCFRTMFVCMYYDTL